MGKTLLKKDLGIDYLDLMIFTFNKSSFLPLIKLFF